MATIVNFFYRSYQVLLTDVANGFRQKDFYGNLLDTILEEDHPRIISAKFG
jgi:hypothetical protein